MKSYRRRAKAKRWARVQKNPKLAFAVLFSFTFPAAFLWWVGREIHFSQYLLAPPDAYFCAARTMDIVFLLANIPSALLFSVLMVNAAVLYLQPEPASGNIAKRQWRGRQRALRLKQLAYFAVMAELVILAVSASLTTKNDCYSDTAIIHRPVMFGAPAIYDSSQLELVQASCRWVRRNNWAGRWQSSLQIRATDGSQFQVNGSMWENVPFARIMATLYQVPFDYSGVDPNCPEELRNRLRKPTTSAGAARRKMPGMTSGA